VRESEREYDGRATVETEGSEGDCVAAEMVAVFAVGVYMAELRPEWVLKYSGSLSFKLI